MCLFWRPHGALLRSWIDRLRSHGIVRRARQNIKWTLIGHSERRTKYGETDADVAEKAGEDLVTRTPSQIAKRTCRGMEPLHR